MLEAMSITHEISSEHNLGRIVCKAEMNDRDVLEALHAFLSNPLFRPGLDLLMDLRELENFRVTTQGIREIALLANEDTRVLPSARVVVVVGDIFTLGMVKMFQSLTIRALPLQLATLDYGEALRYLKLDAPLEAIFD